MFLCARDFTSFSKSFVNRPFVLPPKLRRLSSTVISWDGRVQYEYDCFLRSMRLLRSKHFTGQKLFENVIRVRSESRENHLQITKRSRRQPRRGKISRWVEACSCSKNHCRVAPTFSVRRNLSIFGNRFWISFRKRPIKKFLHRTAHSQARN